MAKELKYVPISFNITNASITKRFFAYLLDLIIVCYTFLAPLFAYLGNSLQYNYLIVFDYKYLLIMTIVLFSYFFVFDYLVGTTLGEMFLGLQKIKFKNSLSSSVIYALYNSLFFVMPYVIFIEYFLTYLTNFSILEFISQQKYVVLQIERNKYIL